MNIINKDDNKDSLILFLNNNINEKELHFIIE